MEGDLESPILRRPAKGPFPYCQPLVTLELQARDELKAQAWGQPWRMAPFHCGCPQRAFARRTLAGMAWAVVRWSPLTSTSAGAVIGGTLHRLHSSSLGDLLCPPPPHLPGLLVSPGLASVLWGREVVAREPTGVTLLC